MLRRRTTVVFVVLALVVFGWENPSPDSTLVLDAFDALAEILDSQEQEDRSSSENKQRLATERGSLLSHAIT